MAVSASGQQIDCTNPIVVNIPDDLNYMDANTTQGRVNNYSNTCMGSYDGGEDIMYELMVNTNTCVDIVVDATTIWAGVAVDDTCPLGVGTNDCIAKATTSADPDRITGLNLATGVYYMMIDTFPSPNFTPYTLTITACPVGACCLNSSCIGTMTQPECTTAGGTWFLGGDCATFDCSGACCVPGGSCQDGSDSASCAGLGGIYKGDATSCGLVVCPPPNDDCSTATEITTLPYMVTVNNSAALASIPRGSCNSTSATDMDNDVWYEWTPAESCFATLTIDFPTYDGVAAIYEGPDCPVDASTEILCQDDPEPHNFQFQATGGTMYRFQIGDWGTSPGPGGNTIINLTCSNATGACCFGDGSCAELSQADCVASNGLYQGDFTECTPNPCPQPPPNDDCLTAEPLAIGTAGVIVDNSLALDDPESTATCGTGSLNQAVWYTVVGTGNTLTASTCNPGGSFNDTKVQVWCNQCSNLVCVGGNDDAGTGNCAISTLRSRFSWCSELGTTYYVAVGGFGTNEGLIHLTVTDDGAACPNPPVCEPAVGACCSNGFCIGTMEQPDCLAAGGTWFVGEDCATFDCGGACCLPDGSCEDVANTGACAGLGGTYQGDATTCGLVSCPQPPPPNDACTNATVIASLPYSASVNTSTAAPGLPKGSCNTASAPDMDNDVWYTWTATEDCVATLTVNPTTYDGLTAVYESPDCPTSGISEIDCADEPEPHVIIFAASNGLTYFFQIGDWGTFPGGGVTTIDFDCSGATGACCLGDGSCVQLNALDCASAGGDYQGDNTDCGTTVCDGACCFLDGSCQILGPDTCSNGIYQGNGTMCDPNPCPQPPPNDDCGNAQELVVPSGGSDTAVGNNEVAMDDITPLCGTSTAINQGVWYTVAGTGNTMTASTCNPGTDFDTMISVFCISCTSFTCVGGNDDAAGSPAECSLGGLNRKSTVIWCSEMGATYLITVGGFSATSGNFELTVSDDGMICTTGIDCQDCNENDIPDSSDIAAGTSADANSNGVPDECEVADCDGDGTPDDQELACNRCGPCANADVDCNGIVNALDLAIVASSANFGRSVCETGGFPPPEVQAAVARADVDRNGIVNALDLAATASSACFGQSTPLCP